ncbi:MAG: DEAD/DEAH box helicase family protein [Caldilineaceae bacterium]
MELSETEVRSRHIRPAIVAARWEDRQIREEVYFTDGRMIVRGQMSMRGQRKYADFLLYHQTNLPLAIVEAKKNTLGVGAGMQQALAYAEALDIPFVYSSNGQGFVEHDRTATTGPVERHLALSDFPTPAELWQRYQRWKKYTPTEEVAVLSDYHYEREGRQPRYYQEVAINRTIEAIARGQKRILLVMATGTGKTFTAFQIVHRLWKAGQKKRILYLADRNILIDQTMTNDFRHFQEVMTKVTHREVDKSYEVYMALYQGLSGTEEEQNIYKHFSPDFFDLIVVDECHRGSAAADSAWRRILEYFGAAAQIGLTATPKETKDVSNIDYFGEPLYTYSLKQGIEDGFLAPYKVMRVRLDIDATGYTPESGALDRYGQALPDVAFGVSDFDRTLVIDERTVAVARRITEYLAQTSPYHKTIVFCVDIEHAEGMRMALVNANPALVAESHKYVMRITGDSPEGKRELDNFIHPEERYPVIATTSKLMTTGVDAQTCHLIVLDMIINSMTEFKQIIGRGTRLREDFGKRFFTILDFRDATRLFEDPDFDGEPVQIIEVDGDHPLPTTKETNGGYAAGGDGELPPGWDEDPQPIRKYYVDGQPVEVLRERVQYRAGDGRLVTESFEVFSRHNLLQAYGSLDKFLRRWNEAERKEAILAELLEQGVLLDELMEASGVALDPFDLICHIAYDQPALTRSERAQNVVKRNYFGKYSGTARQVLEGLLEKYAARGIEPVESALDGGSLRTLLQLPPFDRLGTPVEIARAFGGAQGLMAAVRELEEEIYRAA